MKRDELQSLSNTNGPTQENLGEFFAVLNEVRRTTLDGDSETELPETFLQSSKLIVSKFS